METGHMVGLHQRWLIASEDSLHRIQQITSAVRAAAACSSCFALVDLECLQPMHSLGHLCCAELFVRAE